MRVLQIPSPRWTAYDAKLFDVEMPEGTALTVQGRVLHITHLVHAKWLTYGIEIEAQFARMFLSQPFSRGAAFWAALFLPSQRNPFRIRGRPAIYRLSGCRICDIDRKALQSGLSLARSGRFSNTVIHWIERAHGYLTHRSGLARYP